MFGLIISSRPVITESTPVSPTQIAFTIPTTPPFSHIVVFLLPGNTLPEGTAAAVYAQLAGTTDFKLLGAIANEKPSAIFKINKTVGGPAGGGVGMGDEDAMVDEDDTTTSMAGPEASTAAPQGTITIGISLEPTAQVLASLSQQKSSQSASSTSTIPPPPSTGLELVKRSDTTNLNVIDTKILAQRIIKNCYDFLTSWGSGDTVPLKAFETWWKKFEGKMERDPGFLERGDGG